MAKAVGRGLVQEPKPIETEVLETNTEALATVDSVSSPRGPAQKGLGVGPGSYFIPEPSLKYRERQQK